MNNVFVQQRINEDNVSIPGAKAFVSHAKAGQHSAPGESNGKAKQSGIRCFFGDKELFS